MSFFAEAGNEIIEKINPFVVDRGSISSIFNIQSDWNTESFRKAEKAFVAAAPKMDSKIGDLCALRDKLEEKNSHLLSIFENPNTFEHTDFVDMALSVHHLLNELRMQEDLCNITEEDYEHLSRDMLRAYTNIVKCCMLNMQHLSEEYPYLFSLAVRKKTFC